MKKIASEIAYGIFAGIMYLTGLGMISIPLLMILAKAGVLPS